MLQQGLLQLQGHANLRVLSPDLPYSTHEVRKLQSEFDDIVYQTKFQLPLNTTRLSRELEARLPFGAWPFGPRGLPHSL